MARKRNSSEMEPGASPTRHASPRTNAGHSLERELAHFCYEARIDLTRTHGDPQYTQTLQKTANRYKLLYFKDRPALRRVEVLFNNTCPSPNNSSEDERIQLLFNLLEEPAKAATPQSQKFRNALQQPLTPSENEEPPSPGSPTARAKGIARHFGVSKATSSTSGFVRPLAPPPIPFATKPTPSSSQNSGRAVSSRTSKSKTFLKSAQTSFTTAANTSFASTVPNTSFGGSFWSHAGPVGSQETAASSFNEEHMGVRKPESNFLSSLSSNGAAEITAWMQKAETSQQSSQQSDETARPRTLPPSTIPTSAFVSPPRYSQWTDYGSSIAPSEIEKLIEEAHRRPAQDVEMTDADHAENHLTPNHVPNEHSCIRPHQPPQPQSSPIKSQYHFAQLFCPDFFQHLPFDARWEAQRVLQGRSMSVEELELSWKRPRTLDSLYNTLSEDVRFQHGFPASVDRESLTFSACLEWADTKDGPPFNMVLSKPKRDMSCALQRRLGTENVLWMEVPGFQKPPTMHKNKNFPALFREFSSKPQCFLGKRWVMFFLQPNKKKGERNTCRAIWVSDSSGLSVQQLLDWALSFEQNSSSLACKTYMRLELLLSRTIPVLKLRPDEIAYNVKDLAATRDPDDRRFEKADSKRQFQESFDSSVVMNDGCNQVASEILFEYAKAKGLSSVPSAIQARIGGAKGVWYQKNDDYGKLKDRPHGTKLLWISESQIKIKRDPQAADDEWLSLNVVKHNSAPRPSFLYTAFLPILINAGVPSELILEEVFEQVEADTKEFISALKESDTLHLRRWMQSNNSIRETKNRESGIETIGGFPLNRDERIIRMLECGFLPGDCRWLSREVKHMAERAFDLKSRQFQIRLAQSTTLMGIADPEGCLEPGEVHVLFDNAFLDTVTGRPLMMLDGVEGLVARNPALGAWDIQKIRFVYKKELSRFKNLIVFPTKGMWPLASKLQGGDYDGDTFWMTWSKRLTSNFKNTQAPREPPSPESLGIRVDRTRLSDYVKDASSAEQWCGYLGAMHMNRMFYSANAMLGQVTIELEKLNYAQGTIDSPEARLMIPVHDYMADADKNGYRYNQAAFRKWMKDQKIPTNNPDPRYWEFTRNQPDVKMTEKEKKERERHDYLVNLAKVEGNITDSVYFDVVKPVIDGALQEVSEMLKDAGKFDDDLAAFYNATMQSAGESSVIQQQLQSLEKKLKPVRKYWMDADRTIDFDERVRGLRADYESIQPDKMPDGSYHATVVEWLRRQGHGFTSWELLRASALAKFQYWGATESAGMIMFLAAGNELCYLKLMETDPNAMFMRGNFWNAQKVRPAPKVERAIDDYDSDGVDDVEDGDGYY